VETHTVRIAVIVISSIQRTRGSISVTKRDRGGRMS